MKKLITPLLLIIVLGSISLYCNNKQNIFGESDINKRVSDLLSQMTLEEKVGQMTQITLDIVSEGKFEQAKYPHSIDTAKLNTAILKYKVGSILNTGGQAQTLEDWHKIITQIQNTSINKTRLKIPILYGIDAIHGANYTVDATLFPQQIGQAASWNLDLVKEIGSITAYETRASSIPWNFSPVLG